MDENIQCIFDIENTLFNENRKSKIGREFSSKIRKSKIEISSNPARYAQKGKGVRIQLAKRKSAN